MNYGTSIDGIVLAGLALLLLPAAVFHLVGEWRRTCAPRTDGGEE